MNERKLFSWYKQHTQIIIDTQIYRKRAANGKFAYFYCKEKNCPASCKIHLPLENAIYADITAQHDHSKPDKVFESSSDNLDIKTQCESILNSLISQNPNLHPEAIETLFNQQFPELSNKCNRKQLKADIKISRIANGLNDWQSACQQFAQIQPLNIDFLRSYGILLTAKGNQKFIIWATELQLSILREADHWFVDATFKLFPDDEFKQLLIILVYENLSQKSMPGCFIAMSSKELDLYMHVFRNLESSIRMCGHPMKLS